MKYTRNQTYAILIGLAVMLSNTIVLYLVFLEAFFDPNFIGVLEINRYGEAPIEFIFMPCSLLLGLYTVRLIGKDLKDRKHEK